MALSVISRRRGKVVAFGVLNGQLVHEQAQQRLLLFLQLQFETT
jgi:hypothetical protein